MIPSQKKSSSLLAAFPWAGIAALALLTVPAASAQYYYYNGSPQTFPGQQPIYYNSSNPGIPNLGPDAIDTIGTREYQTGPVGQTATVTTGAPEPVAHAGMSPAWYGIACGLDAMAAQGQAAQILAANAFAPSLRVTPGMDRHDLLLCQLRVQASLNALDTLQSRSALFAGDTQAQLRDAVREADASRDRLMRSLAAAQSASPDEMPEARAAVADNYVGYANAAARVQQLASG